VTVYNSGRSFAIAVNTLYHIAVVSGPVTSGEHLLSLIEKNRSMKTVGGGAIAPDAELSVVNYTSENLDKVAFDDIKDGRQTLYVIGKIEYEDIFKERHYTRFFGAYSPRQNAFQPQNTHNEAN
jgi:hypothetical protein